MNNTQKRNQIAMRFFLVCLNLPWSCVFLFVFAVSCRFGTLPTQPNRKRYTEQQQQNHLTLITCYYLLNVWFTIENIIAHVLPILLRFLFMFAASFATLHLFPFLLVVSAFFLLILNDYFVQHLNKLFAIDVEKSGFFA